MLSDHPAYAAMPTQDLDALRRSYEDVLGFVSSVEAWSSRNTSRQRRSMASPTLPIGRAAWFRDPDGNLIAMLEYGAA